MPSAIRLSASAASAGDAAPSNSNSRRSPISAPLPLHRPDQRAARPPERDLHAMAPLPLPDFDVEHQELRGRQRELALPGPDSQFAGEQSLGELGEIERGGV